MSAPPFLESAATLLGEPDPGPTPFAVESLLVAEAIGAIQGAPKAGKTWVGLELAISIAAGIPAFDRFETRRGPVVLILEESGRAALHRRLNALTRGRGLTAHDLTDLHFAANRRVRLDDPTWRERILTDTAALKPRQVIFDPLVRLKGASTDENQQGDMAAMLDFLRDLRDELEAGVLFVHHTGHSGSHLRGTSDLEGYWESKLTLTARPGGVTEIVAEHREAPAADAFPIRPAWTPDGALRLAITENPRAEELRAEIIEHLTQHAGDGTEDIAKAIKRRPADVRAQLAAMAHDGTVYKEPSEYRDGGGRTRKRSAWFVSH